MRTSTIHKTVAVVGAIVMFISCGLTFIAIDPAAYGRLTLVVTPILLIGYFSLWKIWRMGVRDCPKCQHSYDEHSACSPIGCTRCDFYNSPFDLDRK